MSGPWSFSNRSIAADIVTFTPTRILTGERITDIAVFIGIVPVDIQGHTLGLRQPFIKIFNPCGVDPAQQGLQFHAIPGSFLGIGNIVFALGLKF
jgi:hypothetical protein